MAATQIGRKGLPTFRAIGERLQDPGNLLGGQEDLPPLKFGTTNLFDILGKGRAKKTEKELEAERARQKTAQAATIETARRLASETANREESARLRDVARRRQRAASVGASGRRDTILTGPLGLQGQSQSARKTVLGL